MRKPIRHHLHDYFFPHERNSHCPHLFSITSIAILATAIVVFAAGSLVQTKIVFLQTDFLASVLPATLVDLTNKDRVMMSLGDVTADPLLNKAAQAAAEDMAKNSYFSHVSPDGKDPWYWLDSVGYHYAYAGQNLAVNFTDSENVETAWMNSPTHRANIEKPQYTRVGFGTANGVYEGKETTFVVAFFATPAKAATPAAGVALAPSQSSVKPSPVATSSAVVLGVEAQMSPPENAPAPSWFDTLLTSPMRMLEIILTTILSIVAISIISVFFIHGRAQHQRVVAGGVFLIVLIAGALLLGALLTGPVTII